MMRIVEATEEHVKEMCITGIRKADNLEALRLLNADGQCALYESYCISKDRRFAVIYEGKTWAMFGIAATILGDTATPWFMAIEGVESQWYRVAKYSRKVLRVMLEEHPHLQNYVDVENTAAVQWLQWLGFTIDPAPLLINRHPFQRFYLHRKEE